MAPVTFTEEQLRSLRSIPPHDYIMASQASTSTTETPVTASTDASQADYFGHSSQSSSSNSSRTSVEINDRSSIPFNTITKPSKSKNPLPPLSRDYPKPTEEIDVAEALARKPGRWTFQGSLAVERPTPVVDEEKVKAQRRKALEDAKKELFAASEKLKSLPPRKNAF